MSSFFKIILFSTVAFVASVASATLLAASSSNNNTNSSSRVSEQGVYLGIEGGGAYLQSQVLGNLKYKFGWNGGGAIGYQFNRNWRSE
ncbi:MAG: hypothetical protein AAGA27_08255 [Pseudomonadota bacterium]